MSDDLHAVCPKCKHVFSVQGHTVSDTTLQVFFSAGPLFHRGKRLTVAEIAARANYHYNTARKHLVILADVGLVERVNLVHKPGAKPRYGYKGRIFAA